MAHLLERTKTDRACPLWSRSRLFLSLAGDGRGKISTPARVSGAQDSRTSVGLRCSRGIVRQRVGQSGQNSRAPPSFCGREDASWRRSIVRGRAFRGSTAPHRLDRNDWHHSDFAFRTVSSFGNRMAGRRPRCRANHGSAAAFQVSARILGPSLEWCFQPARARFRISSSRALARNKDRNARCVSCLRLNPRTCDLIAGGRRLRLTYGVFSLAGHRDSH